MAIDDDTFALIKNIEENCKLLYDGYYENVEFQVDVAYHRGDCKYHGKSTLVKDDCKCPVVREKRNKRLKRDALLKQLQEYQQNADVDRNPKAARGAPRVKTPKMHPELRGFFALDEITSEVYRCVDRWLDEAGRDRTWASQPVKAVLMGLAGQVAHFAEAQPDLVVTVDRRVERWVAMARRALKITVADSIFDGSVCGNCGGGLATGHDPAGDMTMIRCVGTPETPPCGDGYPMGEWLKIYESRQS
jgi:hypothetical protein